MHLLFSRFNFRSTCFFVFSLTYNWSCRAKRKLTTWLYEWVKFSFVGKKQVQCRKDSTASKRHVSMFVQEPRLTKELLSFKKSMVRFLFNGEGLDVHLVDLFFFLHLSCPPFFCQTSSRSPCIYICPRSTNYQKYSKGIWIVVGLAHRCHPPHLQPLGVPLLLRALFLQLKHLHLLEHCRLWRTHRQRPIASGIQNPCILDFACRPQWQIKLSFGGSSLLSLTSAKCMQIRHDKSFR